MECYNLIVTKLVVGELETNCYLVSAENSSRCIIIDPGAEVERILSEVHERKLLPEAILLTHGHYDHIGAVSFLMDQLSLPAYIHKLDKIIVSSSLNREYANFVGVKLQSPELINEFNSELITLAGIKIEIIHTPGHTPGSVLFLIAEHLFSGDTIFYESIGRTDLPGGDSSLMTYSLQKIKKLPGKIRIYPGHSIETSVAHEIKYNPFL